MPIKKLQTFLATAEEIVEDLILILLSIFVIILAVSALLVLSTPAPQITTERIAAITQLNFLGKAEYFAALMLPWMLIIIGLLVAREMWLLRRRIESVYYEFVMRRIHSQHPKAVARKRR